MNLVTVNDASNAFGDRQLTVDVIADNLLWDLAKTSKNPDEDLLRRCFFLWILRMESYFEHMPWGESILSFSISLPFYFRLCFTSILSFSFSQFLVFILSPSLSLSIPSICIYICINIYICVYIYVYIYISLSFSLYLHFFHPLKNSKERV